MVPIQLRLNVEENNIIVWQNPAPSSTRYCRPIRFNFAKETISLIKEEVDMIQQQIELLSPVELSQEAQEARNKDNRRYGEFFTRKTTRIDTNTDLLNRLLISSDPFISSLRLIMKRKRSPLDPDVLKLLSVPTVNEAESGNSD
ncbi:hypothetical protein HF086_004746 [Spodoptera exigua]|uniref:Uncharacterized protein n=1 Tax=Spodoptera exigua TaxID=7107 RepID=A0A922SDA3_SPOEX|nr:hypothetical protein HF086_004746 [Spodoptera exigua]